MNDLSSTRRAFLANAGTVVGLAAATVPTITALAKELEHPRTDADFWSVIQQSFSSGRGIVNLNNGGVSPSPRIVTEAYTRYTWQQEDTTAYTMWQILEPQSERIRTELAALFGCDREEIAITRNASESLEILLFGLDLKRGDEVLTSTHDYGRMLTTLRQRELREGIVLKTVKLPLAPKDAGEITRAFEAGITPKTRVILVSHVVNITGQIVPLRAICDLGRSRGIEVIVDGAHSFAHFPFTRDEIGCDYFGTSLHKWLFAPKGTGMLYVRRDRIERLWPLMAAEKKQTTDIRKFEEIGTHPAAPRLAIGEAILFHRAIGAERKAARLRTLARYWETRLRDVPRIRFHTPLDDAQSCAIGTVEIEGIEPVPLAQYLFNAHRIFVTPIDHEEFKGLRITPSVYTTFEELDRFAEVMETIARRGLPTT
ncbi:MAG TPA: aminotransferase class V-fold PLP-dependent enzyme [Thermoanaerobaculia bacterium]|jgi:selenocysteine lyase/cysteine desulfurase|nr:aminotransferase class V-fold PLP-dependent enzyme [Thermoanaerobaculia bacterium]